MIDVSPFLSPPLPASFGNAAVFIFVQDPLQARLDFSSPARGFFADFLHAGNSVQLQLTLFLMGGGSINLAVPGPGTALVPFGFISTGVPITGILFHNSVNDGFYIDNISVAPVATNAPPTLICPAATVVECGTLTNLTAQVSDPEGNAMTVVWTLHGTAVQTNLVPASSPGSVTNISIAGFFPLGTNILALGVTDGTNVASCTTSVTVVDTTPPVLSQVVASPTVLWPPNHKLVRVALRASVSDAAGPAAWSIIGVQCNEPANARGAGNTSPDWSIADADTVYLRAERSGSGNARIYFIEVQATDASGNQSEVQTVTVTVPKSPGRSR